MRALPPNLKFAAYAYAALLLWVGYFAMAETKELQMVAPLLIVLAGSPGIAYGLRRVRRWAYIALVVHAPTVIAIGAITLAYVTPDPLNYGALVHALVLLAYYLRADVRVPYLAHEKRGFRRYKRFETNLRSVVETPQGK